MQLLNLTQEYQVIVLQPQRCLDSQQGKILREKLVSLVPQPQHLWVIDLAQVDFMDSSGLNALVAGLSATRSRGCRLVICNLQPPIRMIFELTRLDSQFEIFENYKAIQTTVDTSALGL